MAVGGVATLLTPCPHISTITTARHALASVSSTSYIVSPYGLDGIEARQSATSKEVIQQPLRSRPRIMWGAVHTHKETQ